MDASMTPMPSHGDISFLGKATEALHQATGLHARVAREQEFTHDGLLVVDADHGLTHELPFGVKPVIDRRDQLLRFKARHGASLLITRWVSNAMANECRQIDLQFIDQAGNCFLRQPGLYVYVSGRRESARENPAATRGLTLAALRLVFAILARPDILNTSVRKMAEMASISHGAVGGALATLEEMGLLSNPRSGQRMLVAPQRWLDAWTEGYLGRLRPKLETIRMSSASPFATLIERVNPRMREVALGGEVAATYRHFGLKPGTLSLYVNFGDPQVVKELVRELKLRRDPGGPVELVSMFWNANELLSFPTVPDALIYADLIGIGDARTMEVAEKLRKDICFDVESQA
ncbi:hypothetical protein IM543_02385 [Massilia sp. UMI-21]|nr:hypothetical protein IM543_02385 [Massilia sp. UMI-21]